MNIFGYDIKVSRNKSEPDWDRDTDQRIKNAYILPWETAMPLSQTASQEQLLQAYKSWVYICANKNANAVADANLKIYVRKKSKDQKTYFHTKSIDNKTITRLKKNPVVSKMISSNVEIEEVEEHPLYDLLNKVNPFMSRYDLWEFTTLFQELVGNAYWYIVKDEKFSIPVQIWMLPPQYVQIVLSRQDMIAGYVFVRGTEKIPFSEEEIIHFKYPSVTSLFYGQGCLSAAIDAYAFEQSAKSFETTLLKNQGRPEGVLQTEAGLTQAEFERLQEQWDTKIGNKTGRLGKTLLLEKGLKYTPLTMSPKDINFITGRKLSREEIAAVFGVPISKLTTEAVNLANAYIGERQYMADTISPRLRRIEEKINEKLMPMYDDNLFVAYDEVIPEDRDYLIKERESNLKNQMTSINMEREKLNEDPVEWGDIPLVSGGLAPLGSQPAGQEGIEEEAEGEEYEDQNIDTEIAELEKELGKQKPKPKKKNYEGPIDLIKRKKIIELRKLKKIKDDKEEAVLFADEMAKAVVESLKNRSKTI